MMDKVDRLTVVGELFQFFWRSKWWWMLPMIVMLMLFAGVVIFAQSSAIPPFIHTLF